MNQERAEQRLREFFDSQLDALLIPLTQADPTGTKGVSPKLLTELLFKIFFGGYRIGHSDGSVESTTRTSVPLGAEVH